jgi:hypothetical protein
MRDKNIYIRNETAFSCLFGNGLPTFAYVVGTFGEGDDLVVMYRVDYIVRAGKGSWRWRYRDNQQPVPGSDYVVKDSGTYTAPLATFRKMFRPDVFDLYSEFANHGDRTAA